MKAVTAEMLAVLSLVVLVVGLLIIWVIAIDNDKELQMHYNQSVVHCVQAGGNPSECRNSMMPGRG